MGKAFTELQDENKQLRAALERISKHTKPRIEQVRQIAREALGKGEEVQGVTLIKRLMEGCVYRSGDREEMSPVHEDKTDELIFDATERIIKLEAALERIRDCGYPRSVDNMQQIAREALQ
jgi:hypothetical protein